MLHFKGSKTGYAPRTSVSHFPLLGMAVFFMLGFFIISESNAQGNLLINPVRIVFEGNKQREEITLANTGQDTAVYAVSFIQYRMTEDGAFDQIESPDPGQYFADEYLRFFPRRVSLAPGESQVIRMQLRRSPDMPQAELRSHLYFRAVPDERPLGEDPLLEDSAAIGVRLVPIFGISIPVIIRNGDLQAGIDLTNLRLEEAPQGGHRLRMTLNRSGQKSVYGDISVEYRAPGQETLQVGLVRGVAVYTPNERRNFTLPINLPEEVDMQRGRLFVRFSSASDAQQEVFAETEFSLNQ